MSASTASQVDLLLRAARTREGLRRWLDDEGFEGRTRLSEPQAQALRGAFEGLLQSLEEQETRLRGAADEALRAVAYKDVERALSKLERARHVLREIPNQRGDTALLPLLQSADRLTQDGYTAGLGGPPPPGASPSPPIVVLEPGEGPAMTPPVSDVFATGFTGAGQKLQVTIPFVYLPVSYLSALWTFTTLQHEVGHHLDVVLGLRGVAESRLADALPGADWSIGRRREHWKRWLPESIADAWGVVLAGEAYPLTLAQILQGRGRQRWSLASPTYPPPALRLALLGALLRQRSGKEGIFDGTLAALEALEISTPLAADETEWEAFRRDTESIAAMLLGLPVNGASGRTLGQAVEVHQEAAVTHAVCRKLLAAEWNAAGAARETGATLRSIPSAAQLAMLAEPVRAAELHERAVELLSRLHAPEWVLPRERLRFFDEVEYFRPTTVEEERTHWKSPPVQLLIAHDVIAFVGATHHQLLDRLREARKSRGARPWKQLELFFLSEERLGWLARDEAERARLEELRRSSMKAIHEYLEHEGAADVPRWVIYEFDRPHYFASYWDWEEPHGRIHISPYIWGQDIGSCPGIDFIRGTTPPHRYQSYVAGLDALRTPASDTKVLWERGRA